MISLLRMFVHEITAAFNPGEWKSAINQVRQITGPKLLVTLRDLLPQLLLYYILLSPIVAAPLYNLMIFHPTMTGPFSAHKIIGTNIQNVFFPSKNGTQLHAWYLQCPHSKRVVLISHGNGGNLTNRMPLMAMFLRSGASVLIYDYQGYGRSNGNPSIDKMCEDADAAYAWLVHKKGYLGNDIIVFGESLGTGVACEVAAHQQVAGIILQSAYSSLHDLAQQKIFWLRLYPTWLFPDQQLNSEAVLEHPHAPLLLVHGKQDRLIPFSHSQEIYRTALPPKTFVQLPDAGHNDIYDTNFDQYSRAVKRFVQGLAGK